MHVKREMVSKSTFEVEGNKILGGSSLLSSSVTERRFRGLFGVSPTLCHIVWEKLNAVVPKSTKPHQLLWAFMFLKVYATEHVNSTLTRVDEKTFRKWVHIVVRAISYLKLIHWSERIVRSEDRAHFSVDGADFQIFEPSPFDPKWFSHKFNSAGLRYEVGVSVRKGSIVWAYGLFPCGTFSNLKIFQMKLESMLGSEEKVIADGAYLAPSCIRKQNVSPSKSRGIIKRVRARHESLYRRLKQFLYLDIVFVISSPFILLVFLLFLILLS